MSEPEPQTTEAEPQLVEPEHDPEPEPQLVEPEHGAQSRWVKPLSCYERGETTVVEGQRYG
jgi:hypothetical protein